MIDFSNYLFRASQMHKLMVGNIGLSSTEEIDLKSMLRRKMGELEGGMDDNGKPFKKLTVKMDENLKKLMVKKKENALPKTMQKEIRKIYRSEKYNRNFLFTNKYVQKGIQQEEEGVSLYQEYRNEILGIKTLFATNVDVKIRLNNEESSGEPDLVDTNDFKNCNEGFDIKCSWSLESFPFADDPLDDIYDWQNRTYMNLTNTKKWTTVYCLVNCTEQMLFNEKQKHFYALGMPGDSEHKYWDEYVRKCADVEKMMIYDYDKFVADYSPNLEISREEWFGSGYNIPLAERVVEKTVYYDEEKAKEMSLRIKVARKYLIKLQKDENISSL